MALDEGCPTTYNGIMEHQITIDASGRLVIPKALRRRFHLSGGSSLILREEDDHLVLIPRHLLSLVHEKAGLLIFGGRLDEAFPDHRSLREERLDRLSML